MLKKFIPKLHTKSIFTIDFVSLYERGIRVIMFDLDNTLISYNEKLPNEKLFSFKENLESMGFEVILVSNSKKDRVSRFAENFKINYVKFAKKPLKKGFKEAMTKLSREYNSNEVCEIGDQIMTDILGANRMGFLSILVDPIDRSSEKLPTKFNRFLEKIVRFFLKLFHKVEYQSYLLGYRGERHDS